MRLKTLMLLSALAWLPCVASAQLDLAFALTPAALPGVGSNEVVFTGSLTNTSMAGNLFLNNVQFSFNGAATNYLMADSNAFFGNVPGILLPGEVYSDVVFGIPISTNTPPGNYTGTITLQGGADIFACSNLASQAFQISLPPATLGIALSGGSLVVCWPSPPAGFVLQQNPGLGTTNWMPITNTLTVTNGMNEAIISPAIGNQYFRLSYP